MPPLHAQLSSLHRHSTLQSIDNNRFDLIIIGGGITGAGIALDAASRGLRPLLLEMQDFGAGTSSRSTKLIHGGLRYLKQGEVGLVREVGQERALLHHNAPHIVRPKKMLLPIIENGSLGRHSTSMGLFVYDLLAGVEMKEWRSMHNKEETLALEPLLRQDIVIGGGLYFEYQTDDARLTIEVLKTAAKFDAICLNYVEVVGFHYDENGKAIGVKAIDRIGQTAHSVYAPIIVNAAGPWVDSVRSRDQIVKGKRLHLTKGVHIVVPYEKLPLQQAVYFDVKDGRMIFAIPRQNTLYIGTTDTNYNLRPERPGVTIDDVQYLLEAVNTIFPSAQLGVEHVLSTWSGVRPLIHEDGKDPSELSRKDEIFLSPSGIISIAGGKLTGFRKMAQRTVDKVMKKLYIVGTHELKVCITDKIKLSGGNFAHLNDFTTFVQELTQTYAPQQLSATQISNLADKYGRNTDQILQIWSEADIARRRKTPEQKLLLAELHYGIRYEMVISLADFLIRRTGRLYFERPDIAQYRDMLLDEIAKVLQLSRRQKQEQAEEFEKEYNSVLHFTQDAPTQ